MANSATLPPSMNRYQLKRLRRGKARSRAPIIKGTMKLPSVLGIDGIRKNHTMMMPCMVNRRLYMSELTRSASGVASSIRIIVVGGGEPQQLILAHLAFEGRH